MDEITILLVEDNHGDVNLVEQAFEDRGLPGTVHAVQTGEEALDRLHGRAGFSETPRPNLVLLDLNLPATSGQSLLEEIKSDPRLERVPVVVLTGSKSEDDLIRAYEAGANAFLVKPVDPEVFANRMQEIAEFWGSTVSLPPVSDSPVGE